MLVKVVTRAVRSLRPAKTTIKWPVKNSAANKNFSSAIRIVVASDAVVPIGHLLSKKKSIRAKRAVSEVNTRKKMLF